MPAMTSRLKACKLIGEYHFQVIYKQLKARGARRSYRTKTSEGRPPVTILVTNTNNRYPLELTLRSMVENTRYPDYEIWVADNGSTDGSVEMVEQLMADNWPIRLIRNETARPQHLWYDFMMQQATTPFWVGVHEDMMFIAEGWLEDLVDFMEAHPDTYLLGGEYFPPQYECVEPVSQKTVDLMESLSTWLFCARRELGTRLDTSFAYHDSWDAERGRTILYDQGGKLIADMRERGLGFACMPKDYRLKWQHIANISWAFKYDMNDAVRAYKLHQLSDVKRRARSWREKQSIQA